MKIRLCQTLPAFFVFLLTACQPLPHPFEDDQLPPDASILAVPEVYGVVVEPIVNAPRETGPMIQQAMVQALQDAEIPAAIGISNTHSFRLSGEMIEAGSKDGGIHWVLRDSAGVQKGEDLQHVALSQSGFPLGKLVIDGLVREEAQRIAALIVTPGPVDHSHESRTYILPIKNAPGDGAISLARSLGYLLSKSGVNVTDDAKAVGTVKIQGQILIAPAPDNQQQVKIIWHVINPSGAEVGQVSQENTVAKGSLNGAWSEIAMAVASAARDDLIGLIGRVPPSTL